MKLKNKKQQQKTRVCFYEYYPRCTRYYFDCFTASLLLTILLFSWTKVSKISFLFSLLYFFSSTSCLQVLAFTIRAAEANSYFVENILDTLEYEYLFPALLQTQMSFELSVSRQTNACADVFMQQ